MALFLYTGGDIMKVVSLFSGLGAFEKALFNLEIPFELIGFCEIDKYASKSYCAIHNVSESLNLGDITQINEKKLPDFDLMTYGFPCQDISVAGKQQGIIEGETRSGLLFEALRIAKEKKPKYMIAENVKNLVSKKFKNDFFHYLQLLEEGGYNNYWQVLNAKDYGVPQNRERVFIVSIRKDIDKGFEFPEGFDTGIRLKDIIEDEVDEKYYLSQAMVDYIIGKFNKNYNFRVGINEPEDILKSPLRARGDKPVILHNIYGGFKESEPRIFEDYSPTIRTASGGGHIPSVLKVGNTHPSGKGMNGNVFSDEGLAPTITTNKGEGSKILSCSLRTRNYINQPQQLEVRKDEFSNSITTVKKDTMVTDGYIIRKLTPKECLRLQGFKDKDYFKMKAIGISDTQLYKQAGNSIVVNVLEGIFKKLFNLD